MPAAKPTIDVSTATAPGPPAPAIRNPRNAMFPVMKAEKTLPRARKLMASTAPDETVNALSRMSRILAPTAPLPAVVISRDLHSTHVDSAPYHLRLGRRYVREDGLVDVEVRP